MGYVGRGISGLLGELVLLWGEGVCVCVCGRGGGVTALIG